MLQHCGLVLAAFAHGALCAAACSERSRSSPYFSVYFICITTGAYTADSADSTLLQLANVQINDEVMAVKVRIQTHSVSSICHVLRATILMHKQHTWYSIAECCSTLLFGYVT
jgi:hypothetical protein